MSHKAIALSIFVALPLLAGADFELREETDLSLEGRYFHQEALQPVQTDASVSLALQREWYAEWNRGDHSITATPFLRKDWADDERSHADLRELHWQGIFGPLEVRAGVSRVFWGKTELLHLVDIINQDDAVENLDGEDKLGQPMLRLNWVTGLGSLQTYVLPYFRERTYPGVEGRLRAPLVVNTDAPIYEDADEENHIDYALRFQGYLGAFDYGLAWFIGTHRDPQLVAAEFVATPEGPQPTELRPFYGQLDQLSLDAQYTRGGWLLKLEAVHRDQSVLQPAAPGNPPRIVSERYAAATGGFEYTAYGVFDTTADLGLLLEYQWDERGRDGPSAFQNDLFLGTRLSANDVAGSTLLAGIVGDLDHGSAFVNLEASRRLGGSMLLSIEYRGFTNIATEDVNFFPIRRDDYLQLELSRYF